MPSWILPIYHGEGRKPGEAKLGEINHYIESIIQGKLCEDPEYQDLELMEKYLNTLDTVKGGGIIFCNKVDPYFVHRCIHHYNSTGTSAGSATSLGDASSTSHVLSQETKSSVSSHLNTVEMPKFSIPFSITTAQGRPRPAIAVKTPPRTQSFINERVVRECGFTAGPDSTIKVTLTLKGISLECSLDVRAMEVDMLLSETLLLDFRSYNPDYVESDYNQYPNEPTEDSTSHTTTARPTSLIPRGSIGHDVRQHQEHGVLKITAEDHKMIKGFAKYYHDLFLS
ncbi:hypothetical protein HD806DRAFT_329275 [Xylariaceae sp. AK1471]|nr:hypothetical protein HD806DRAFT_329275 [Xylariaceae sp. AK1471]